MPKPLSTRPIIESAVCALVMGLFSSLGDWIWANFIQDGAVVPGVVHGVLIFLLLALLLSWTSRTRLASQRLLLTLPLAGLAIAALFYPIAYVTGYLAALLISWIGMWCTLAWLLHWAQESKESLLLTLARGFLAAIGAGLAFWSISGIWTGSSHEPVNYLHRAVLWSYAFLPGFLALLMGRESKA